MELVNILYLEVRLQITPKPEMLLKIGTIYRHLFVAKYAHVFGKVAEINGGIASSHSG